jgi:uncharacterized phage-associated protein
MYQAIQVANWFISKAAESGDLFTHLKVQKLLYYAEAWTQVLLDQNLFNEKIQAWAHGPVVPEVFQAFKEYGWNPLPIPPSNPIPNLDNDILEVLTQVYDTYGDLPAKTLESMTHDDAPWITARGTLEPEERCEVVMPKDRIKEYFKHKYAA